jgi:ribosome recycling factor
MPINQVASIAAVDASLLQVTPYDPSNIEPISSAIRNNPTLGLNPSDDGRVIRLPIPALTEERRRELAKQINQKVEECMVRVRAVRHEAMDQIEKSKKDKEVGEDEAKRLQKQIEEAVSSNRNQVDEAAKKKEQEILSI